MTSSNSKALLELEAESSTPSNSSLESKLLFCKKDDIFSRPGTAIANPPDKKPQTSAVPKSQVLGKVKDFLSIMSESNKKLLHEAQDNPDNYDMEVLSGKESEYIEMDLMLGVADLHTPEAVAAAESAMAGYQPPVPLVASTSDSESEDDSDDDGEDGEHIEHSNDNTDEEYERADVDACPKNVGSKAAERGSSHETLRNMRSKKRSKIVELS